MQNDIVRRPTQPALNRVHEQPNVARQTPIVDAPTEDIAVPVPDVVQNTNTNSPSRPIAIIVGAVMVCAALVGLAVYGALNPEPAVEWSKAQNDSQTNTADQSLSTAPVVR